MTTWNGMKRTRRRRKYPLPRGTVQALIERDGARCAYRFGGECGGIWTADHVIPYALALRNEHKLGFGANHMDNLVLSCLTHNIRKLTRRVVPRSWRAQLDWLNGLGISRVSWVVWDGGKLPEVRR